MVSDIVLLKELPEEIKNSVAAYVGCIAGATTKKEYLEAIQAAGFGPRSWARPLFLRSSWPMTRQQGKSPRI